METFDSHLPSSLPYSSLLSVAYEFNDCEPGLAEVNCEHILTQNEVAPENVWWYCLALVVLFLGFRLIAMFALRQKGAEFSEACRPRRDDEVASSAAIYLYA